MQLTYKAFTSLFSIIALLGLGGCAFVAGFFDPNTIPPGWLALFYVSFFTFSLALFAVLSGILGFFSGKIKTVLSLKKSLREPFLLAAVASLALFFQAFKILNVYVIILLIAAASSLELYLLNKR